MAQSKTAVLQPNQTVYYPAHGVGTIVSIEEQDVLGTTMQIYVVSYDNLKMVLRVPVEKAHQNGLEAIDEFADPQKIALALKIIVDRSNPAKGIWNRRAIWYESKINHGDLIYLAEVIRDINRGSDDGSQINYSEQQIFDEAIQRLVDTIAAVRNMDEV